jgi:hypothetical protein
MSALLMGEAKPECVFPTLTPTALPQHVIDGEGSKKEGEMRYSPKIMTVCSDLIVSALT